MGELTILVGLSGSGKSTWAAENCGKAEIISSDALREELLGDVNDQAHNSVVFETMGRRTKAALKEGKDVIYDATNLSRRKRTALIREMGRYASSVSGIVFAPPIETCMARRFRPDRTIPVEAIEKQLLRFEPPYYSEGFSHLEIVPSERYSLDDLLMANKMPHDSSYHTDDTIYDHMRRVEFLAAAQEPKRRLLRTAALFHDVGKFRTKTVDASGEAHYYGHEHVGAYYYLNASPAFVRDRLYVATLIDLHMKALRGEMGKTAKYLSEWMAHDLRVLVRCDAEGA